MSIDKLSVLLAVQSKKPLCMVKIKTYCMHGLSTHQSEANLNTIKNLCERLSNDCTLQAVFISSKKGSRKLPSEYCRASDKLNKNNDVGMFRASFLLRVLQETRRRSYYLSADEYRTCVEQIKRLTIEEVRKENSEFYFVDALLLSQQERV